MGVNARAFPGSAAVEHLRQLAGMREGTRVVRVATAAWGG